MAGSLLLSLGGSTAAARRAAVELEQLAPPAMEAVCSSALNASSPHFSATHSSAAPSGWKSAWLIAAVVSDETYGTGAAVQHQFTGIRPRSRQVNSTYSAVYYIKTAWS